MVGACERRAVGAVDYLQCVTNRTSPVVFSGVPASGKTTLALSLEKRGYSYFSLNGEDDARRTKPAQQAAYAAYRRADVDGLLAALASSSDPVVVEWGFPPDDVCLQVANALREAGARFVWFDCPIDIARRAFRKREQQRSQPIPLSAFDHQVRAIGLRHDLIIVALKPQIVHVRRGKTHRSLDDLVSEIFGARNAA